MPALESADSLSGEPASKKSDHVAAPSASSAPAKTKRPKGSGGGEKKKKKKKQTPQPDDGDDEKMSSFCALEVYKRTKVTEAQRVVLRKYLLVLAAVTVAQFAVGGYLYNLTSGRYRPKRGSWYVGIAPVAIIVWGWRVQTHTGLCINLALGAFSSLIAAASMMLDVSAAGLTLELNACAGFNAVEWFKGTPGDAAVLSSLATCTSTYPDFKDSILPPQVCMCVAGKSNACVVPYEVVAADSCRALGPYGGLLVFAATLCVACFLANVLIVLKEVHFIKARAREVQAKYGDLYNV